MCVRFGIHSFVCRNIRNVFKQTKIKKGYEILLFVRVDNIFNSIICLKFARCERIKYLSRDLAHDVWCGLGVDIKTKQHMMQ